MRFFSSKTYDNLYEYLIASYKVKKIYLRNVLSNFFSFFES